jgi:hypothetical protein
MTSHHHLRFAYRAFGWFPLHLALFALGERVSGGAQCLGSSNCIAGRTLFGYAEASGAYLGNEA